MKTLLKIALTLVIGFNALAQEKETEGINWVTMDEALELQKNEPRKIIMDVYTNWCGPCKMLDKYTFGNSNVVDYINKHYYAVKFNGEGDSEVNYNGKFFRNPNYNPSKANRRNSSHEFARYLRVSAYPTMVFFDEESNVIAPIKGYLKPQQIELYLKLFKTDKYKEMTTQESFNAYYESFEPTFKD